VTNNVTPLARKGAQDAEEFFKLCSEERAVPEEDLKNYLVGQFVCTKDELDYMLCNRDVERWKFFYRTTFTAFAWETGVPLRTEGFCDEPGAGVADGDARASLDSGFASLRRLQRQHRNPGPPPFESNDSVRSGIVSSAEAVWKLQGCQDDDFPSVARSVMSLDSAGRDDQDVVLAENDRLCDYLQALPVQVISSSRQLTSALGRLPNVDIESIRSNACDVDYGIVRSD
jgi:hypothetical protein